MWRDKSGRTNRMNIYRKIFALLLLTCFSVIGCGTKQDAFPAETADNHADEAVVFSSESLEKWVRYSLGNKVEEGEALTAEDLGAMMKLSIIIENEAETKEVVLLKEDMEHFPAVNEVSIIIEPEASGAWIDGYENLKYLSGLETLWIEDATVEDFSFLQDCSGLKKVTVTQNELPENFLDHCHNLEQVQIYNCTLPENLCHDCPELKSLTVMGSINDPDIFAHLTGLEEIIMNETDLDNLEFVRGMKNLKTLSVRDNRIQDISPALELSCLEKLYINNNKLDAFDLQELPDSLLWLAIGGNPNVTLTSEIFAKYSVVELWHDKEQNLEIYAEELRQSQKAFDLYSLEGQWSDIAAEGDIVFGGLSDDLKCEIDDCFAGDINGDGIDDLGVIINAVDELGPCGRWLYIYPKEEKGYGIPYKPVTLGIPSQSGAAWSDAVSGALICDERLIIQQVSGTSTSYYYTYIYCHDEEGWKEEARMRTMFSFVSDGIIQTIINNYSERVTKYMYGKNEEGVYEKVCTGNYGFDENPYIGMPIFSLKHTDFQVYNELREMPFSTTQALEATMEAHFAGDKAEKVQNNAVLVRNYEKIFGINIPDYYYLVQRDDFILAVHFEDWTEEGDDPVYKIIAEYYDKDENAVTAEFDNYNYNARTGKEE